MINVVSFGPRGDVVRLFGVEKTSASFNDAELTDEELGCALRIHKLITGELPDAFKTYLQSLRFKFTVDQDGEATLLVRVHIVLQDPGAMISVTNAVVVLDDPVYEKMVAKTTISLMVSILTVGAREKGAYAQQYLDAARMLIR